MDSIKGAINSLTGGNNQQEDDEKHFEPQPHETGLQSRGQTTETSGGFTSSTVKGINTGAGGGRERENEEDALDKGWPKSAEPELCYIPIRFSLLMLALTS